jgi:hypothetical protein
MSIGFSADSSPFLSKVRKARLIIFSRILCLSSFLAQIYFKKFFRNFDLENFLSTLTAASARVAGNL